MTLEISPWLLAALLLLAAMTVAWWLATTRTSRHNRRRQRAAQWGEDHAETLLEQHDFIIEARQVTARWTMFVDGEPHEVFCRADLVVQRGDQRFVAEVKTGTRAPEPTLPATRRQLLEYRLAFAVDGLLLVDIPAGRVVAVDFPYPEP